MSADTVSGDHFIVARATGPGDVPELDEENTTRSTAITIDP